MQGRGKAGVEAFAPYAGALIELGDMKERLALSLVRMAAIRHLGKHNDGSMDQTGPRTFADRVEIVSDISQLRAQFACFPVQWEHAVDLFQTLDWFDTLVRHGFVDGVQPWLPLLRNGSDGAPVALPLALSASGGLRALSNYYSSLYGPVGPGALSPAAWHAFAQHIRLHRAGGVLNLQPLDPAGEFIANFESALRAVGYWADRYDCFGNWYLPVVHSSFDAYAASLPAALRHSIGRGRRRLEREGGFSLGIHDAAAPDLAQAIADFETVYAQSWKTPEPCPRFMPELMRRAADRGWLRLGIVQVQGRPIAAQLWLVKDGKANIYKLAYVQGFERFSPGSVLTAALMAHVMDVDRVREVDYLTGDDAYKRDWMTHRRVRVGLVAFDPRRVRGLLEAARHFGGRRWRGMQALLKRFRAYLSTRRPV